MVFIVISLKIYFGNYVKFKLTLNKNIDKAKGSFFTFK